jgi:hypothetical protein
MNRFPVISSNIKSIGYDGLNGILEVEFHSKSVYSYEKVGIHTFKQLMAAESQGKYFNKFIKGHFEFKKIPNIKE